MYHSAHAALRKHSSMHRQLAQSLVLQFNPTEKQNLDVLNLLFHHTGDTHARPLSKGVQTSGDGPEPLGVHVPPLDFSPETTPRKTRIIEAVKISLPHIGLVLLSTLYTLMGALIFYKVEQPNERRVRNASIHLLRNASSQLADSLWALSQSTAISEQIWKLEAGDGILDLLRKAYLPFTRDYVSPEDIQNSTSKLEWTFAGSLFFSWTSITTIGYGHIVPRTLGGRIGCLVYTLFGIPLILVTIADMGRFLSEGVVWAYRHVTRCKRFLSNQAGRCLAHVCTCCKGKSLSVNGAPTRVTEKSKGSQLRQSLNRLSSRKRSDKKTDEDQDPTQADKPMSFEEYKAQLGLPATEKRISVFFVLFILLGYTAMGAFLLRYWENWSFFDTFYYCFVTVTTIGFGDIVPQNESFLLATLAYITLGLIITTMCIDLVGTEYIKDIHFYGRLTRQAFMNIGRLGDIFAYMSFMQTQYGVTPEELSAYAHLPPDYLLDCIAKGQRPDPEWFLNKPYIPWDIHTFKWIEQPRTTSFASERLLASIESAELMTSRLSTARTPREYYHHLIMQYWKDHTERSYTGRLTADKQSSS